jgi:hypothetical protein
LRKGEQNILWPTDARWFAKSSGTTGDRSKYIPVSREALEDCHYKGGKDLIAFHFQQFPESKLYQGMSLVVGGSSNIEQFRADAYSGDLSAIIIRNLPIWVEVRRTPVIETALMENWEEKIERMAREDHARGCAVHCWCSLLDLGIVAPDPGTHRQEEHLGGVARA